MRDGSLNWIKMCQRNCYPDSQAAGVPFIGQTTTELICDDLSRKAPTKSLPIWGSLDCRPSSLLPGHDKPVLLSGTVDVNHTG